ncbi:MAG: ferrous iron transport protein A [Clostridia bacterium]|nr:ferrous iron transport protein A [Clostridia bacterium]
MPIVLAPINKPVKVIRIFAEEKTKKHLESLGITINSQLTVLSSSGGSVVCRVKDGKIALDGNLSTKIMVTE